MCQHERLRPESPNLEPSCLNLLFALTAWDLAGAAIVLAGMSVIGLQPRSA